MKRAEMISFNQLAPRDQVFSLDLDGEPDVFHFAVTRLHDHLKAAGVGVFTVAITPDLLRIIRTKNGVEPEHLARVKVEGACITIVYTDGLHYLIDGSHRVLKAAMDGHRTFPSYIVQEDVWRRFLIGDFPVEQEVFRKFLKDAQG